MLSEKEICKIICSNPPACTCTDNCPICFSIKSVGKAVEAQHKADLEDFQKQKQEMWLDLWERFGDGGSYHFPGCNDALAELQDKWGIE